MRPSDPQTTPAPTDETTTPAPLPPHLAPLERFRGSSVASPARSRPEFTWLPSDGSADDESPVAQPRAGRSTNAQPMGDSEVLREIVRLQDARTPCVLCTVIGASGSAPRKPGAKMLVLESGEPIGTIGGGAVEHEVIRAAREALRSGDTRVVEHHLTKDLGMCCGGTMRVFVEPQVYAPPLVVFGAGHVAKPLAAVAAIAGFDVHVVDARPEWAKQERFPQARVVCSDPMLSLESLPLGVESYALVLTHDHGLDLRLMEQLLTQPRRYTGVIGSKRKRETFRKKLAAALDANSVQQMRSPIGLDIGAVTPEEIAVSVVAELVRYRRSEGAPLGPAASMTDT